MSPLEERRERAREAYWDTGGWARDHWTDLELNALDNAIETATRVRITPEILSAFRKNADVYERGLKAALKAAGFEVEQ